MEEAQSSRLGFDTVAQIPCRQDSEPGHRQVEGWVDHENPRSRRCSRKLCELCFNARQLLRHGWRRAVDPRGRYLAQCWRI